MFNKLLEVRVRQATEDLEKKCQILETTISTNRNVDHALQVHCESILEFIRQIRLEDNDAMAIARAAITRIERRLEAHLGLIRNAVRRDPEKPQQDGA
jgi:cob(I)alamin adenosyltransferase